MNSVHISDLAAWCKIDFEQNSQFTVKNSNPLIYAHHLYLNGQEVKDLVIPDNVTSISYGAFYGCSGLTSVTIGKGITSIHNYAFNDCSGITSLTFHCANIGNWFDRDSPIQEVIIGDEVSSIGESAFSGFSGLTSVTIPNSVTSIGEYAFSGCSSLTSIDIPNSVTSIGDRAFSYCSGLTSVTIGNSVTSIGDRAFQDCSGLTSVTIGNSVTSIGEYAFSGCSSLTSIDIPNSVTTIEMAAFWKSGLTNVIIPNSVTTIGGSAFESCSGLTSVTIGSGVTSIGNYAFSKDENIVTVNSLIEEPFAIEGKSSSSSVFHGDTYIYGKLKVPFGTKDKYKATKGWRDFDTIEEGVDVEIPGAEKCATPTISYNKGELTFSCDTEGATCKYTITDADIQSGSGNKVQLSVAYQVSVVAMKDGYNNSETAEATLCWVDVQPQTEGVEVATALQSIEAQPVLIQANGQVVSITGAPEGAAIAIYDTSGKLMGSGKATAGTTDISTQLCNGDVAIVKIGDRAVKVVVK